MKKCSQFFSVSSLKSHFVVLLCPASKNLTTTEKSCKWYRCSHRFSRVAIEMLSNCILRRMKTNCEFFAWEKNIKKSCFKCPKFFVKELKMKLEIFISLGFFLCLFVEIKLNRVPKRLQVDETLKELLLTLLLLLFTLVSLSEASVWIFWFHLLSFFDNQWTKQHQLQQKN